MAALNMHLALKGGKRRSKNCKSKKTQRYSSESFGLCDSCYMLYKLWVVLQRQAYTRVSDTEYHVSSSSGSFFHAQTRYVC